MKIETKKNKLIILVLIILFMKKIMLFTIVLLFALNISQSQTIKSYKTIENDSIFYHFSNPFLVPLAFNFSPVDSLKNTIKLKEFIIIQPNDTIIKVLEIPISIIKDTSKIDVKKYINFKGSFGDPTVAQHNTNYLYSLPYSKNKRHKIIQSFNGKFSHNLPHSKYAIDFNLQVGDTITAAREGLVFFIKEDSKKHGKTKAFTKFANKILIFHEDGTYADYSHIDFNGALVNIGDKVKAGEPIAISGLTGFTTTPHLHFVVFEANGISTPIFFKKYKGEKLKKNKYYKRKG